MKNRNNQEEVENKFSPVQGEANSSDSELANFDRRNFLKVAGFSFTAGAAMLGCARPPIEKAIPFLIQPEEITPGKAYWYASTCGGCNAGCGILAKNRDGRPIKLEGNPDHPISSGGLCAVGQASILGLYDSHRLKKPISGKVESSWATIDKSVISKLESAQQNNSKVRILTGTTNSPSTKNLIDRMLSQFQDGAHIEYDPISYSAILDAHKKTHKRRALPHYHFDKAEVIIGFDCDFLGTWISPVEFTADYVKGRNIEGSDSPHMNYHMQFEGRVSITGSKADHRVRVSPDQIGDIVNDLTGILARKAGSYFPGSASTAKNLEAGTIEKLADRLWSNRGKSLVVCGSQDIQCQININFINHLLASYGTTVDIAAPSLQNKGSDAKLDSFLSELNNGELDTLIVQGVNPVFDLPNGKKIAEAIKKVPLSIQVTERKNETSEVAQLICAEGNFLESWNDFQPTDEVASIVQPVIERFGDTRTMGECISAWSDVNRSAYDLVKDYWFKNIFPQRNGGGTFQSFWDNAVHDGFAKLDASHKETADFDVSALKPVETSKSLNADEFVLTLYPSVNMHDGRHSYNPFLLELPDPVAKLTWDNFASVSAKTADKLGVRDADILRIKAGSGDQIEVPVYVQHGQDDRTISVALGYGSAETQRFGNINPQWIEVRSSLGDKGIVGVNASQFIANENGTRQLTRLVTVAATGEKTWLAATQEHHSLSDRDKFMPVGAHHDPIIKDGTLENYNHDPHSVVPHTKHAGDNFWPPDHEFKGAHWGMVIDMNLCTGCEACVVSCQIENNIPVVGKDEVRRNREMHWLRIDRYYSGDEDDLKVVHQPMMCQHCENAPCETVCPVLATTHSSEGLNQQIYNRCVGTRYCSNNCPYKVRRFNWFNYSHDDEMQNLLLNPDVTVRSRGIMEKCSLCVQRIQEAKIAAKVKGVEVADGDIQPACQQSCPAGAIVFGDLNDPESKAAKLMASQRRYRVLEEINVRPSVGYLALIRNRTEKSGGGHHG